MYIKRLLNPMEMVRALVRGEVGRREGIVYLALYLLGTVAGLYLGYLDAHSEAPPFTFAFVGGDFMLGLLSIFSIFVGILVPMFMAWENIPMRTFVKYFASLSMPLTILPLLASVVIEPTYAIINGSFDAPVSGPHFALIAILMIVQSAAMPYLLAQAIVLRAEGASK